MSTAEDRPRPISPNVVQGMAPPHSIEAEQSVIGAVLLSDKAMYQYVVSDNLQPRDFYRERHQLIFESMVALWDKSEPIDVLTVTEHLRARGKLEEAGGQGEIDALTATPPSVGALRQYAQIVKDNALLRNLLTTTYEIQASVHARDLVPRDIVDRAEREILEVAHDDTTKDFREVNSVLFDAVQVWHRISTEGVTLTGTPSGFADLDEITGGFQPGNLIIIAARPSMGKSALVTNIAENVSLHPDTDRQKAVALFSLEMSEAELAQRFIASQSGVKGDDLRKGRLKDERKWKRVLETAGRFEHAPLFVDDSSDIGIMEIRAKARRLHQQHPLGMIIVDYLQLLRADGRTDNRVEQVGAMSRGLKILARELDVPVIALSQLSRGVESRTDKRPLLSDLRECVTGDTPVLLSDGRRAAIRELVGTTPEVLAIDEDDRIVSARSDLVWRVGRREVFTVWLASGRSLRATAEHRVRTGSGWLPVGEIGTDDAVAVAREPLQPHEPLHRAADHDSAVTDLGVARSTATVAGYAPLLEAPALAASALDALFWDRVVAVGPAGEEEVFDLTVPGPACWLADGIVSHNSGQIEQDADLVAFIYRDEYYNRETEALGEAELIIAKHRNGSLGTVELMFQPDFPRFLTKHREAG